MITHLHAQTLFPPLVNVVGIAVGVSIAGFVLLVVLPICVVIGCCYIKHNYQGAHLQLLPEPHNLFLPLSLSTQQTPMASKVVSSPIQLLGLMSTRHHHKSSRCLPTLLHSRLHTFPQPTLHTLPPTHLGKLRDTSMTRDCTFIRVCISVYHILIGIGHAIEHCY